MALRREDLSPDERARHAALDLSWAEAQRGLADPEFRAYLIESMRRIDAKDPPRSDPHPRGVPGSDRAVRSLVPLRDLDEFHRWVEREAPSMAGQRVVRHFLAEVGDESWRSPSIPLAELSAQPEYEVRQAALRVEGEDRPVQIWYRHTDATDVVDVMAVTNL